MKHRNRKNEDDCKNEWQILKLNPPQSDQNKLGLFSDRPYQNINKTRKHKFCSDNIIYIYIYIYVNHAHLKEQDSTVIRFFYNRVNQNYPNTHHGYNKNFEEGDTLF